MEALPTPVDARLWARDPDRSKTDDDLDTGREMEFFLCDEAKVASSRCETESRLFGATVGLRMGAAWGGGMAVEILGPRRGGPSLGRASVYDSCQPCSYSCILSDLESLRLTGF